MAEYSIRDLENFTNIKAHTLRMWEQRYQLLHPERTETNIRTYSDRDLKKILNINLLYNHGLKISKIAALTETEITNRAAEILMADADMPADEVNVFVKLIVELQEVEIRNRLARLKDDLGIMGLYTEVMIPLLRKIGDLWQIDTITVSHEHFFSNILREFISVEINNLPSRPVQQKKVVLFLHEREMHELSLMFYHYFLKFHGYECFYLGQNVPFKDLERLLVQVRPDFVLSSLIAEAEEDFIRTYFQRLSTIIEPNRIFLGGFQTKRFASHFHPEIHYITSSTDLETYFV